MKKIAFVAALAVASVLTSCYGGMSDRPIGMLYAKVADPVVATTAGGSRTGTATATSYLGLVATGDSSIEAAKKNGGISTVSSVDVQRENILGIISTYTTTVKGN